LYADYSCERYICREQSKRMRAEWRNKNGIGYISDCRKQNHIYADIENALFGDIKYPSAQRKENEFRCEMKDKD